MEIAIIGTGNVGKALGKSWAAKGHQVIFGSRDPDSHDHKDLLQLDNIDIKRVAEAAQSCEIILLATPAMHTLEIVRSLGDTKGKIIIDAMNIVGGRGPEGYRTTAKAVLDHTDTQDVIKCFNTTGANNMQNPVIDGQALDMFMAGDSEKGKKVARQLANDAGFANCYDIGGNDKFEMMEEFARFWINLAMFQGMGREIGFKLIRKQ